MDNLLSYIYNVDEPAFLIDKTEKYVLFNRAFLSLKTDCLPVKVFHFQTICELDKFLKIDEVSLWIEDCIDRPRSLCRTIENWRFVIPAQTVELKILPLFLSDTIYITGQFCFENKMPVAG